MLYNFYFDEKGHIRDNHCDVPMNYDDEPAILSAIMDSILTYQFGRVFETLDMDYSAIRSAYRKDLAEEKESIDGLDLGGFEFEPEEDGVEYVCTINEFADHHKIEVKHVVNLCIAYRFKNSMSAQEFAVLRKTMDRIDYSILVDEHDISTYDLDNCDYLHDVLKNAAMKTAR